jgi:hypothetical protein
MCCDEVEDWWTTITFAHSSRKLSIASLLMHVNNMSTMPTIIFYKNKLEARTWVLAA